MSEERDPEQIESMTVEGGAAVDVLDDDGVVPTPEEAAPEAEAPFPSLTERWAAFGRRKAARFEDDPAHVVEGVVSFLAVALSTALVLAVLHPTDILSDNTATGGDMGSHLWGPRVLIDHLLPNFRLSGWTPDWYNGFPAYQFYMVVPSLFVVLLTVGLPWWAAIPALAGTVALGLAGWARERFYPYRYLLLSVAIFLALVSVPISYNRSFKIVTVLGLVFLPFASWLCAKLADLPFPTPPLVAGASLIFIFNREPLFENTGNIIGGNFQSTMAGEFAFSVSLTLSVLYLGVAARGLRTGKHRALAAGLFALAGLCHLIPAFFVLACTAALFVVHPDRKRFTWLATMVPVAGLLTAFWVIPFAWRADYVNDMGWERLPKPTSTQPGYGEFLWPSGLHWLLVMAVVGVVVSLLRRYPLGQVLALAWAAVSVAFVVMPQYRLWNARLLPFMYLSVSFLAAIAVGEIIRVAAAAAAGNANKPMRSITVPSSVLVLAGVLVYVTLPINGLFLGVIERRAVTDPVTQEQKTEASWTPSLFGWKPRRIATTSSNPASGWSLNNYQGLEEKVAQPVGCDLPESTTPCTTGGWNEFRALIQTMAGLGESPDFGCGRAFWEYDGTRLGGYGTPMAPMMLPYFTDGCIGSQEGLYFESSATVPHHFLVQSELSASGSGPQRKMVYPGFDIDAGVQHLQLLGVKYYLASTTTAVDAANRHPDLTLAATSGPWHIYLVADSEPVSALAFEPVVMDSEHVDESQEGWLPMASAWFLDTEQNDVVMSHTGPEEWARVEVDPVPDESRYFTIWARQQLGLTGAIDQVPELPRKALPDNEVTNIEMGTDTISFDVSNPGVPVLVKTSYFPNWEVEGAERIYRVTPNLMVVIPTEKHVSMHFGRTPVDLMATGLSVIGLILLAVLARRRPVDVAPWHPGRVSEWIDSIITITPGSPPATDEEAEAAAWRPELGSESETVDPTSLSAHQAARVLLAAIGVPPTEDEVVRLQTDSDRLAEVYRRASQATHPDQPQGSNEAFHLVASARAALIRESEPATDAGLAGWPASEATTWSDASPEGTAPADPETAASSDAASASDFASASEPPDAEGA